MNDEKTPPYNRNSNNRSFRSDNRYGNNSNRSDNYNRSDYNRSDYNRSDYNRSDYNRPDNQRSYSSQNRRNDSGYGNREGGNISGGQYGNSSNSYRQSSRGGGNSGGYGQKNYSRGSRYDSPNSRYDNSSYNRSSGRSDNRGDGVGYNRYDSYNRSGGERQSRGGQSVFRSRRYSGQKEQRSWDSPGSGSYRRPPSGGGFRTGGYNKFNKPPVRKKNNNKKNSKKSAKNYVSLPRMLALLKFSCRKVAVDFIQNSRVRVNNNVITDTNYRVHQKKDKIVIDEMDLRKERPLVYILMYKPSRLVASKESKTRSVHSLVPESEKWFFPAGRLSKSASGLVIFTNDPSHKNYETTTFNELEKEYHVKVQRQPLKTELTAINKYFKEKSPELVGTKAEVLRANTRHVWVSVVTRHATPHDISLALKTKGLEVLAFHRFRIGGMSADMLTPGAWKQMNSFEINQLFGKEETESETSFFFKNAPYDKTKKQYSRNDRSQGYNQNNGGNTSMYDE